MTEHMELFTARDMLCNMTEPLKDTQRIPLEKSAGRILAREFVAAQDVPQFDRSAYDGYAFMAQDTVNASKTHPVTLEILEEIPAGKAPSETVIPGTAVKILTGAPIPKGADAVVQYELTQYTHKSVTLTFAATHGSNIVRMGEDVEKGCLLAERGTIIDPALAGTLAAQGVTMPEVYRRPRIGIISTGNEVVEPDEVPSCAQIRNSNRYIITAALQNFGCDTEYLGLARDDAQATAHLISKGLAGCDAIVLSGGVSAGDYDLTPEAITRAGAELLAKGVNIKPGMACAYGIRDKKLIIGLSGNPAAALTNLYAVAAPAIKKLCGYRDYIPALFDITLSEPLNKKSRITRLLQGRLELSNGRLGIVPPGKQGNAVISAAIGCNVIAIVPSGSDVLPEGTVLKGFLI